MKFSEKLRTVRQGAHMTQEELARRLGLAKRTVEGYESGAFYPRKREVYDMLSEIFSVDKNYFLTEDDAPRGESGETAAAQVLETVRALYAGGDLRQEDKDALAQALMEAYWVAKRKTEAGNGI